MNPTLDALTAWLHRNRRHLDQRVGEARQLATTAQRLTADIAELRTREQLHDRAAAVLASIADERQTATQERIEALVTQGLHAIFGEDLSFHIIPTTRAKTPVVDLIVRSRIGTTTVDTPVMDARGGGLAAVVGFLLRLVVLLLSRHRQDTVLVLDETFAHLSAEYEPRMAEFLRELVDRTGVQVILVTHSDAYSDAADVRYRFTLKSGETVLTPV